ncbi:MAG: sensor histidine kinase [Actinomycetota bacterium]
MILVAVAVGVFLAANDVVGAARPVLAAIAAMVAGLGLIFGPWIWRLTNELVEERRQRIRADERAELARMVHDSVLQTLTLIQRNASDPVEVSKLARRQERELRSVLYGMGSADGESVKAAAARAAAEVEDLHGVPVEVVTVGDCPLDDRTTALVLAAREALVNAAKFSGASTLSLYAEVEPERVTIFVRDRGKGFDPAMVPDDRRGIAESIKGRVERHDGTAVLRTAPGEGTEWELSLTRERARA